MKKNQILLLIFLILIGLTSPTFAASPISFVSDIAEITAPAENGLFYPGYVLVEGNSQLEKIWLCVKAPSGEITYHPVNVENHVFQYKLYLRFGQGSYTIWVGDNLHYHCLLNQRISVLYNLGWR